MSTPRTRTAPRCTRSCTTWRNNEISSPRSLRHPDLQKAIAFYHEICRGSCRFSLTSIQWHRPPSGHKRWRHEGASSHPRWWPPSVWGVILWKSVPSHRIHEWHVCQHLGYIDGKCYHIWHTWILWVLSLSWPFLSIFAFLYSCYCLSDDWLDWLYSGHSFENKHDEAKGKHMNKEKKDGTAINMPLISSSLAFGSRGACSDVKMQVSTLGGPWSRHQWLQLQGAAPHSQPPKTIQENR